MKERKICTRSTTAIIFILMLVLDLEKIICNTRKLIIFHHCHIMQESSLVTTLDNPNVQKCSQYLSWNHQISTAF